MSLPAYSDYKNTGVDWLGTAPRHWRVVPLWTLFKRKKRTGFPDEQLLSVYRDHGVIPKASRDDNNNKPSDDLSAYQLVEQGDLAINKMKAWQGSVAISNHKGIVSPAYFIYAPSHNENPRFLHYLLRSPRYITGYLSLSKGIRPNQWDLEPQHHSRMPVLLPAREEQTAIAAFLDRETGKIDALIAEQEKLLTLLAEKRQATISHAVTRGLNPKAPMKESGVEWLGEVPAHWDILPLRRVVRQFVDYRGATPNKVSEGVPLITATQIKNGRVDHSLDPVFISEEEYADRMTRGFPAYGDLLLTTEAPLGQVALVDNERVAPGQRIILMKVREHLMTSVYLHAHFRSDFGQGELWTRASGSTASGIRADRLRGSAVLVPPLDEQQEIDKHIKQKTRMFDKIVATIEVESALLRERRAALIAAAVTGTVDVRNALAEELAA
jgi:type I restriction enzyme S subunit